MATFSQATRQVLTASEADARRGAVAALRVEGIALVRLVKKRARAMQGADNRALAPYKPSTVRRKKGRIRPGLTDTGAMIRSIRLDRRGLTKKNPDVLIGPSGARNARIMALQINRTRHKAARPFNALGRQDVRGIKDRAGRRVKREVRRGGRHRINIRIT